MLNYHFVILDHPRSLFMQIKLPFKFRVCTFRVMTIWIFRIAWNSYSGFPKSCFFGSFYLWTLLLLFRSKKHFLARNHAFWALNDRCRSNGVTWKRGEEYKKENQKCAKNRSLRRPPARRPTSTKFCMRGRIPDIFLGLSFKKISWKMWELWGVDILAFPLTRHIAYTTTTACCYCTSQYNTIQW